MQRSLPFLLILMLLVGIPAIAQQDMGTMSPPPSVAMPRSMTPSPTSLLFDTVSSCYNLDPVTVSRLRDRGWGATDVVMAANLSARSGRPLSEVVQMYDDTKNWNSVASRLSVSTTDMYALSSPGMMRTSPGMMRGGPEVNTFERASIRSEYRLNDRTISSLRDRGFSWSEIRMMANASARTGRPITEIADLRTQGMGWSDIAQRYNVRLSDLETPSLRPVSRLGAGSTRYYSEQGITPIEYDRLHSLGWTDQEIRVAGMIRARSNASLDSIVRLRQAGLSWNEIGERYNISYRDIERSRTEEMWLP